MNLHNFIIRKRGSWDKFKVTYYGGNYYSVSPYFHGNVLTGSASSFYINKVVTEITMEGKKIVIRDKDGFRSTEYVYIGMYSKERSKKDKEKWIKVLEKRMKAQEEEE